LNTPALPGVLVLDQLFEVFLGVYLQYCIIRNACLASNHKFISKVQQEVQLTSQFMVPNFEFIAHLSHALQNLSMLLAKLVLLSTEPGQLFL
jgi:hypothetical protein